MPPHLNLTLLNVPPALDPQAMLPRPWHVILNHSYIHREGEVGCFQSVVRVSKDTNHEYWYLAIYTIHNS